MFAAIASTSAAVARTRMEVVDHAMGLPAAALEPVVLERHRVDGVLVLGAAPAYCPRNSGPLPESGEEVDARSPRRSSGSPSGSSARSPRPRP